MGPKWYMKFWGKKLEKTEGDRFIVPKNPLQKHFTCGKKDGADKEKETKGQTDLRSKRKKV